MDGPQWQEAQLLLTNRATHLHNACIVLSSEIYAILQKAFKQLK